MGNKSNDGTNLIAYHPDPPVRDSGSFRDMMLNIRDDVRCYMLTARRPTSWLREAIWNQGVWATIVYRYGAWARQRRFALIRIPLRFLYAILKKLIEILTSIHIDSFAEIGPGLVIDHFGPVFVGGDLGAYCNISPGVTIGLGGPRDYEGRPQIGHRVYIAPGAKIFGAITIGNDVMIGPNSVVNRNLEDNVVVLGNPVRVVGRHSSYENIDYPGKPPVNPTLATIPEDKQVTPSPEESSPI